MTNSMNKRVEKENAFETKLPRKEKNSVGFSFYSKRQLLYIFFSFSVLPETKLASFHIKYISFNKDYLQ